LLCLLIVVGGANRSVADEADVAPYARAADCCRGDIAWPIALLQDKRLLCLDGVIASNPASAIKTRLVYQHYPDSQEEVDAIAKRLGLIYRVIYAP